MFHLSERPLSVFISEVDYAPIYLNPPYWHVCSLLIIFIFTRCVVQHLGLLVKSSGNNFQSLGSPFFLSVEKVFVVCITSCWDDCSYFYPSVDPFCLVCSSNRTIFLGLWCTSVWFFGNPPHWLASASGLLGPKPQGFFWVIFSMMYCYCWFYPSSDFFW